MTAACTGGVDGIRPGTARSEAVRSAAVTTSVTPSTPKPVPTPATTQPVLPAVQGSIEYATSLIVEDPDSRSVIVLFTDGEPGVSRLVDEVLVNDKCFCFGTSGCPDEDENPYVLQAVADAAAAGIPTFVAGAGEVDPSNLNAIAEAGGTDVAFILDVGDPETTKGQFAEALATVRTELLAGCAP
ncbi:MAG: hypothetical protein JW751_19315 [Polyangiaceae bacterium]|nr:hypothetical protein [Polyangiaceae bacterium]